MTTLVSPKVTKEEATQPMYFPTLEQDKSFEKYIRIAKQALKLYEDRYVQADPSKGKYNYFAKAEEAEALIKAWTDRHHLVVSGAASDKPTPEELISETEKKVEQYTPYRAMRDETRSIIGEFNKAIVSLTLPKELDSYTLEVLRRLDINVAGKSGIMERAETVFGNRLKKGNSYKEQLVEKKAELESFLASLEEKTIALRVALEPLARYTSTTGYGLSATYNWAVRSVGSTPYVNALVKEADITKAKNEREKDLVNLEVRKA